MPELHKYVCMYVEDHFGHERGFLNNAMATVYETGKNQYIPLHADKAHSFEATGKIENKAPIYNCVDTGLCNSLTSPNCIGIGGLLSLRVGLLCDVMKATSAW